MKDRLTRTKKKKSTRLTASRKFCRTTPLKYTLRWAPLINRILSISYKDHVTNEEVRARIQQAIGPHEGLLTVIKRRKLQWCGHVFRSSGLAKTIMQGTVKGERRQDRQRKRWEDIREWTGLEFGSCLLYTSPSPRDFCRSRMPSSA